MDLCPTNITPCVEDLLSVFTLTITSAALLVSFDFQNVLKHQPHVMPLIVKFALVSILHSFFSFFLFYVMSISSEYPLILYLHLKFSHFFLNPVLCMVFRVDSLEFLV